MQLWPILCVNCPPGDCPDDEALQRMLMEWPAAEWTKTVLYTTLLVHSEPEQRIFLSCRKFEDHVQYGDHIGSHDECMAKVAFFTCPLWWPNGFLRVRLCQAFATVVLLKFCFPSFSTPATHFRPPSPIIRPLYFALSICEPTPDDAQRAESVQERGEGLLAAAQGEES